MNREVLMLALYMDQGEACEIIALIEGDYPAPYIEPDRIEAARIVADWDGGSVFQ